MSRVVTAGAAGDDEPRRRSVEIILAMLAVASDRTRGEIQRLLAAKIQPPPTAAQQRVAELSFLSSLLDGPVLDGSEFRQCAREEYDRLRPPEAPTSRRLVNTYGSWSRACRAAYGLQADGSSIGPGRPWPSANPGKRMGRGFTREEALDAVRLCAKELRAVGLAGAPTSWQYDEWVRRRRLEAERRGQMLRLPYAKSVYRRFPKRRRGLTRWQVVLRAAGLGGG